MALPIEVVWSIAVIFELKWAMVILPVFLDRLEENEWVATAVAELVLGEIRGDRVDPRRELLGLIEPVQVRPEGRGTTPGSSRWSPT